MLTPNVPFRRVVSEEIEVRATLQDNSFEGKVSNETYNKSSSLQQQQTPTTAQKKIMHKLLKTRKTNFIPGPQKFPCVKSHQNFVVQ